MGLYYLYNLKKINFFKLKKYYKFSKWNFELLTIIYNFK